MTEPGDRGVGPESPAGVAEAEVSEGSRFSLVWLIPIVAAVIGVWLAWVALSQRGPTVTISFESAAGLEAGKTKVRYKELEVGLVKSVDLTDDLSRVVVTAELAPGTERLLTEKTRFWVVRARVSGAQISGLGTLLSGAYVGMDPATEGASERDFVGLEVPPVITAGREGRLFHLRASELGGVDVGSPVHFRSIGVGEVVARELSPSGDEVRLEVFVDAPHHERVREGTLFWDESGIDVALDAEGVRVNTSSLEAMLIGGIAFETPDSARGDAVPEDFVFTLYASKEATHERVYRIKRRFLMEFEQSVRGLVPGSPVELRGIRVGQVIDVRLVSDPEHATFRTPVLIELEPERAGITETEDAPRGGLERLVARGLRARLRTGNLITGQLAVELDFFPDAEPAEVDWSGPYPKVPTIPTPLHEIQAGLTQLVNRLEDVPIEAIGQDLRGSLGELRAVLVQLKGLSGRLNDEIAPSLASTVAHAESTLGSADELLAAGSPTRQSVEQLLLELSDAARSLRVLADYLERHPESLLRGKEGSR